VSSTFVAIDSLLPAIHTAAAAATKIASSAASGSEFTAPTEART
jgi:hypothetical protein